LTSLPVGVGFGISTPEQAARVATFADAVIVGSAIARVIEDHASDLDVAGAVEAFAASLASAVHGARAQSAEDRR
jgi:tryptophan synthase alpha chain